MIPRSIAAVGAAFLATSAALAADAPLDYSRDVRPILSANCFACHGLDEAERAAGLRLDLRDTATAKLESGATAIVPGNAAQSELIERITSADESLRMPPADSGHSLTEAQIDLIRRWIDQGATYAGHWAFTKPQRPAIPSVTTPTSNPIDNFVRARLEREGLAPSSPADRETLIRRVSLDVRGLPPSPDEVQAFLADTSPDAYEKLVDRMLADPGYGERWARVWLDLARYADSAGYGSDPLRTIWAYRDWVIDAFNANMPYDEFTIEQIAGDLLKEPSQEQLVATAFHRNTMTNTEGGTDDEEFRVAAIRDRADTTAQVWMGLTLGCAKCHTHKYDPITHADYYSFYAIFNQTADNDQGDESPTIPVSFTDDMTAKQKSIDAEIAHLLEQWKRATPDKSLIERIAELEKTRPATPTVPVMRERPVAETRETRIHVKGNFLDQGDKVEASLPDAFSAFYKGDARSRLDVANWLVDAENPLTARVAVNRLWARLFGAGIVETEEDFGTQGDHPSHPELLDWLATEFVRLDWDTKAILRLIVTSETYKQSSRVTPEHLQRDPRNRLLTRAPRTRLEAELVRDQALATSGLLSRKMRGPSVYPPQPEGLWRAAFNGRDRTWATSEGPDRYRRGLYTFWRRTVPYPSMATFDAPSREICTVRRISTNTPLQAFVTMNDPVYVEASQALARRIATEGGPTPEDRAAFALRLCLVRDPESAQVAEIVSLYETELAHFVQDVEAAKKLATEPLGPLPEGADPVEFAAWTVVANVLMNLDGVLTRN